MVERDSGTSDNPTEFDLLEGAIESFNEADVSRTMTNARQADLVGTELGKIAELKVVLSREVPLPQTGFTSTQWATAERLYVAHLLDPEDPSTIMLKYFQKQHDYALVEERRAQKALAASIPSPVTIPETKQDRLIYGTIASGMAAAVGLAIGGVTYITQDQTTADMYPMLTPRNIEAADPTPKVTGPMSVEQLKELSEKVEARRVLQKQRADILRDRMLAAPATWVGGITAVVGSLSAATLGAISIFRNPSEDSKPSQDSKSQRRYQIITGGTRNRVRKEG